MSDVFQPISIEQGKIPPQAVELEVAVLSAIIVFETAILEVMEFLNVEHFYLEKHRFVYGAALSLVRKSEQVDLLTVSNELKTSNRLDIIGGDHYLAELSFKAVSSAHVVGHAKIVLEQYLKRQMIALGNLLVSQGYESSIKSGSAISDVYKKLDSIGNVMVSSRPTKVSELYEPIIKKGRSIYVGEILAGLRTPIEALTKVAGGWRDGEFIVLAARPGMGKTSFALNCAKTVSDMGISVGFFSLEMTKTQLATRVISSESGVNGSSFNAKGLSNEDLTALELHKSQIEDVRVFIEDEDISTIEKMKIKAHRMKKEHGVGFLIIDYLQLMKGSGNSKQNREQEISEISRGLKELSKSLDIPIMALSQLSRSVETRGGNKRPMLSDLRESGSIEQDADMVMFIYRPEYYHIREWDDYSGSSCIGEAEYIVSKNRNGGLIRNRMKWIAKTTTFSDLTETVPFDEVDKTEENDVPF